jgi:predicted DNA-binding protein (MmcQ/YjbR family)
MDQATVNHYCAALKGAALDHPFGEAHDVWKVGGKIFAICSRSGGGVCIKTPSVDDATFLIESGAAERAPYLHRSWALILWGRMDRAEAEARIARSYAIIVAALPRKNRPTS